MKQFHSENFILALQLLQAEPLNYREWDSVDSIYNHYLSNFLIFQETVLKLCLYTYNGDMHEVHFFLSTISEACYYSTQVFCIFYTFVYSETYSSQLNMFVLKPTFHSVTELINAHANLAAIPPSFKISNALLAIPKLILKKSYMYDVTISACFFFTALVCTHVFSGLVISRYLAFPLAEPCRIPALWKSLFFLIHTKIRDLVYLVYD